LIIVAISLTSYYLYVLLFPKPFIEITNLEVSTDRYRYYNDSKKERDLSEPSLFQEQIVDSSDIPDISAETYFIYNPNTYQVLLDQNSQEQVQIASLTKLMTAVIVMDSFDMNQRITLTKPIPNDLEWNLQLTIGDSLTVQDALHAMLMSSYNDMAYLFAVNYPDGGYDAFIEEMNLRAGLYGMENTHYANSYGFDDPDNYSTARDIAKLVEIFAQTDHLMKVTSKSGETITIRNRVGVSRQKIIYSTNYLLGRDPRVIGLKTGSTKQAGACFTGYFVIDNQTEYIAIILGSEADRFKETTDLVQYVLDNFE
jgi:D-alanyl-D-alanine carboxypeptidase (penicillin-binding protein 5/6)